MKTTAAGPQGSHQAGYEYDVPDPLGRSYISAGAAEAVEAPPVSEEPAPAESDEDEAAVEPEQPEAAVTQRGRRQRRAVSAE